MPTATTENSGDAVMKSATDPVVDPAVEPTPDAAADPAVDPADLLAKGKRDLLCGEVPNAVNQLQEACRLLSTKFGETADECGEAYFYYGKALLDLSRMESGVLGNALQGTLDDDDEKSDEKSEEAAEAAEAKASEGLIEKVDITEGETSQEEEEDEEEGEEVGEGDTEEEGEGADKDGEEKEEDVSNLQLAWEMLELAKIIYKRHTKREMKLKLAEAYLKLGEVGLETENYDQSVGDFKECLKLQKELMEPEDRCLAETCYQLGLATGLQGQYDDAVIHYKCAASIIEAKMGKLNAVIEEGEKSGKGKEPACADDPVVAAQKEVKDLQDILPDIMAKIEDILDEQRNAEQVKKMVKENVAGELGESTTGFGTTETSTDDTKAVSDITHLVRKKRKPEDDADETTKKAKTEEEPVASNGTANGTTNGEAKVAETVKAS